MSCWNRTRCGNSTCTREGVKSIWESPEEKSIIQNRLSIQSCAQPFFSRIFVSRLSNDKIRNDDSTFQSNYCIIISRSEFILNLRLSFVYIHQYLMAILVYIHSRNSRYFMNIKRSAKAWHTNWIRNNNKRIHGTWKNRLIPARCVKRVYK